MDNEHPNTVNQLSLGRLFALVAAAGLTAAIIRSKPFEMQPLSGMNRRIQAAAVSLIVTLVAVGLSARRVGPRALLGLCAGGLVSALILHRQRTNTSAYELKEYVELMLLSTTLCVWCAIAILPRSIPREWRRHLLMHGFLWLLLVLGVILLTPQVQ